MFSRNRKVLIFAVMLTVVLNDSVMSEFLGWNWFEDVDNPDQSFSSPILTTTASSAVNCLVICTEWVTTVAATFNLGTSSCDCYDGLTGMTPHSGNRLLKRIPPGYEGSMLLRFYVKLYNGYWKTYAGANAMCALEGARLVVLDTMEKINIIPTLPDYNPNLYYLVAATDNDAEDTFVWSTGSPVSRDAQIWHDYQPNNSGGNQNCLTLFRSKYDDVTCSDYFQLICEML